AKTTIAKHARIARKKTSRPSTTNRMCRRTRQNAAPKRRTAARVESVIVRVARSVRHNATPVTRIPHRTRPATARSRKRSSLKRRVLPPQPARRTTRLQTRPLRLPKKQTCRQTPHQPLHSPLLPRQQKLKLMQKLTQRLMLRQHLSPLRRNKRAKIPLLTQPPTPRQKKPSTPA